MRIILYAGKGGVGKTSLAAASGAVTAQRGLRTLVMSLDPAHSLSDAFDLDVGLMDKNRGQPVQVADRLWIQELDVHEEIANNWGEVHGYLSRLLHVSGVEDILAEELAILPGMEEVSALLYLNRYQNDGTYDLVVLDCAPTAESLRFVSLPRTLEWYMNKIFNLERRLAKMIRPVARRLSDVPLPDDDYFSGIERLYNRMKGVDRLMTDPSVTTVRLVTNLEKMVLRETQRAFMFFCLHQLSVDAIIVNRVYPEGSDAGDFKGWSEAQKGYLDLAETYFRPIPILKAPLRSGEVLGYQVLLDLGQELFRDLDPAAVLHPHRPYQFDKKNGRRRIKLHLPFVGPEEVDLTKTGDELIIRLGNFKKNVILPRAFAGLIPAGARVAEGFLVVEFAPEEG